MTLNLELDEQQAQRLQDAARRLNVSVSDLAKAAINDLLAKRESDFEHAATRVLKRTPSSIQLERATTFSMP